MQHIRRGYLQDEAVTTTPIAIRRKPCAMIRVNSAPRVETVEPGGMLPYGVGPYSCHGPPAGHVLAGLSSMSTGSTNCRIAIPT